MQIKSVVVLDTNVVISGIISPLGSPGVILRRYQMGDFALLSSPEQIKEINDVFKRPKIKKLIPSRVRSEVKTFLDSFHNIATVIDPPRLKWDFKDTGDYFLLDLVAHTKPDYLVTGDKALRSLLLVMRTAILTPSEFLAAF